MDLLDEFTTLIAALEAQNIDYATCGGLALAVHGHVRDIKRLQENDDES